MIFFNKFVILGLNLMQNLMPFTFALKAWHSQNPLTGSKWALTWVKLIQKLTKVILQWSRQVHLKNCNFEPVRGPGAKNVTSVTPLKIKFYIIVELEKKFFWLKIGIFGINAVLDLVFAWFNTQFLKVTKCNRTQNVP